MKEMVAINGEVFKPEDAKISVFDRGFLFGDGIYEVSRSYGRVHFALEDHIDRLFRSADRIGLNIGYTKPALIKELYRLYDVFDADDTYMRVVITRGEGVINIDPTVASKPNIVVFFKTLPPPDRTIYEKGIDIVTASVWRNSKQALDPNIKSGNYLNNILALGEARRRGAADAVMVNRDGHVTEGTTSNIWFVKNGVIVTPPDEADILWGITRKYIREIIAKNKMPFDQRFFTPDELKKADEVFTTGSVKEVVPVKSVDGVAIGTGKPSAVTQRIAQLYKDAVKQYCQNFKR